MMQACYKSHIHRIFTFPERLGQILIKVVLTPMVHLPVNTGYQDPKKI